MPDTGHQVPQGTRRKLRVVGMILLCLVPLDYAFAWWLGRWPNGHPWSGISFALLGLVFLGMARNDVPKNRAMSVLVTCALVASIVSLLTRT